MDVDGAGLTIEIESPGFLQKLLTAEDKSAVFSQGEEKVKFLRTQVEAARVDPYLSSGGINGQVAKVDRRGLIHLSFRASQNGFDAGNQFARVERLGQVVIRAHFESQDFIDILVTSGEHEDGCRVIYRTQTPADFKTVEPGEHDVQYNKSRMLACYGSKSRFSIVDRGNAKAFALQIHARKLNNGGFVVYEEDEFIQGQCSVNRIQ